MNSEDGVPPNRVRLDEVEEWRNSASNFLHLIRSMFEQDIDCDVVIKVGVGSRETDIECHSLILSAHSPVMRAMLSQRWSKATEEPQRKITLMDDDPEHFLHFVNMMYWDWNDESYETYHVPENPSVEITIGVLALANKYLACRILRHVEYIIYCYLTQKVTVTIVKMYKCLKALPGGQMGQIGKKILRTVTDWLLACGEDIFGSAAVLLLSQRELIDIVQTRHLLCPEHIVFNGCYYWAKEQCKLKKLPLTGRSLRFVLGWDVISCIRFPLLSKATIVDEVLPKKILREDEALELLSYVVRKECSNRVEVPVRFSASKRNKGRKLRVTRFDKVSVTNHLVNFSTPHGLMLKSSKDLMLKGLEFFGGCMANKDYSIDVKIEILQEVVGRAIEMKNPNYGAVEGENVTLKMEIRPKVKIPADIPVKITFAIKGGHTVVSTEELEDETKEICYWKNELITFRFKSNSGYPNGLNQIPTFLFTDC